MTTEPLTDQVREIDLAKALVELNVFSALAAHLAEHHGPEGPRVPIIEGWGPEAMGL